MQFTKKFQDLAKSKGISIWERFNLLKRFDYYLWKIDWMGNSKVNLIQWLKQQYLSANKDLIEESSRFKEISDYDDRILAILRFVCSHITYKRDINVWKTPEYWQNAITTYNKRTGDCEDGAILIFILARLSGIPSERIRLLVGSVTGGGHAMVEYTGLDLQDYIIDWCYYPDFTEISKRKPRQLVSYFKKAWFRVNDCFGWEVVDLDEWR